VATRERSCAATGLPIGGQWPSTMGLSGSISPRPPHQDPTAAPSAAAVAVPSAVTAATGFRLPDRRGGGRRQPQVDHCVGSDRRGGNRPRPAVSTSPTATPRRCTPGGPPAWPSPRRGAPRIPPGTARTTRPAATSRTLPMFAPAAPSPHHRRQASASQDRAPGHHRQQHPPPAGWPPTSRRAVWSRGGRSSGCGLSLGLAVGCRWGELPRRGHRLARSRHRQAVVGSICCGARGCWVWSRAASCSSSRGLAK